MSVGVGGEAVVGIQKPKAREVRAVGFMRGSLMTVEWDSLDPKPSLPASQLRGLQQVALFFQTAASSSVNDGW